jgi:hypothetical protein
MVQAAPSLSPKRAAERMQRFHGAVRTIALYRAKKAVQAQIKARGQRISDYSCRDITVMAEAEFERNREELIARATQMVATFPEFSRYGCAQISSDAQKEKAQKSITSAVQMLGAE